MHRQVSRGFSFSVESQRGRNLEVANSDLELAHGGHTLPALCIHRTWRDHGCDHTEFTTRHSYAASSWLSAGFRSHADCAAFADAKLWPSSANFNVAGRADNDVRAGWCRFESSWRQAPASPRVSDSKYLTNLQEGKRTSAGGWTLARPLARVVQYRSSSPSLQVNSRVAVRAPIPPAPQGVPVRLRRHGCRSMPLHYLAWRQALGEWGCKFSEERFYELGGVPIVEIIELLGREQGIEMPIPQVAKRKEGLYFEHLPKLKCVPEVLDHIELQHGRIPFAVVSGSTRESVEASLRAIGLLERFDVLVCAGDYVKSKPDPEPS